MSLPVCCDAGTGARSHCGMGAYQTTMSTDFAVYNHGVSGAYSQCRKRLVIRRALSGSSGQAGTLRCCSYRGRQRHTSVTYACDLWRGISSKVIKPAETYRMNRGFPTIANVSNSLKPQISDHTATTLCHSPVSGRLLGRRRYPLRRHNPEG